MNRVAAFESWDSYISQGPAYKKIADWWIANSGDLPGPWGSSISQWQKWYMDKYRNEWGMKHRGPEESLASMKDELDLKQTTVIPYSRRPISGPVDTKSPGVSNRKDRVRSIMEISPSEYFPQRGVGVKNNTVDIDGVSDSVKEFIRVLGEVAVRMGAEKPIITSGYRTVRTQARIMASNWKTNGGVNGGREYLVKIYPDDIAVALHDIFMQFGSRREGVSLGAERLSIYLNSNPKKFQHVQEPGRALDLRLTRGINEVIDHIVSTNQFDMTKYPESDHIHVNIYGVNRRRIANIH
jgi:hypothetical protein